MADNQELWTITDIAKYLKMSKSTIYKNWRKLGVRPIIVYPGAKPRFYKDDVIRAVKIMK